MANLVDIFTQTSGLKGEATVLSTSEDLPKDKPSLFDSLLKTSIEDIENSSAQNTNSKIVSQNITSNLEKSSLDAEVIEVNTKLIDEGLDSEAINLDENSNSEEVIKDLSKNITNELNKDNTKKDEIKEPTKNIQNSISSKNSLLDRLVLEVKNSNLEQVPKVEQILSEPSENADILIVENEVVKTENNTKVDQKLSLMDQLIQTNSKKDITTKIEESATSNPKSVEQINKNSKDVASNIFLAEQKNSLNNQLLFNKNEAVNILKNASSIEDIEKSANILDLDANNLEVEQNISSESLNDLSVDEKEILDRKNILNSILNEKNIRSVDVRNLITNSIEASKALLEDTINILDDKILDIQPNLVNSIQSRIVGAKQQMASMMSDVARQMYENYKPPVTVFRMNLNPGDLGTISVLMKQDKSSGLTINMSVSNIATLELLMENQNMLRNSLAKTFNDSANFNLDFSKGEGGQSQGDSSSNQNQRDKRDSNTQEILKLKKENKDYEEKNDYM
ncbi:flagellar hook-length control protein FliK [Aliarcobacter cryaerophilus]|uniref:flagellar hook-length control protein FliK n=1 Tax=Aliarcobacter cryaerophilus TaxID=28198 RepID=UPI0021B17D15|nr:flagellar hook-length control protein FliK [Aliarcobacter cryaerophilus]MCT7467524.1 flagellar hook-length control protein FliK [Aliarcobacter cryaerophilus]